MVRKNLFITEKPSVAVEFARALRVDPKAKTKGYIEDDHNIITWCVGHLIEMSYPEKYDPTLKKWEKETLPFLPENFKYEVIERVEEQYEIVKSLLNRTDIEAIYYSGDSAREGEYIQRLVRQEAGHNPAASEYRVWIDSQTKEEILNGIRNAKPLSAYDHLSDSAYARAIEDYLVGINFSRALSIKYAKLVSDITGGKHTPIAVGRVMSCVLGMIVQRERQIRSTKVFPFYGIKAGFENGLEADWKIVKGSQYDGSPVAYKDVGLSNEEMAKELMNECNQSGFLTVTEVRESEERKAAPLLFNLAELQAECTKRFHISPQDTLDIAQKLYEKKLTTYPRTDARVLTTAICKVFDQNIQGLTSVPELSSAASNVLSNRLQEQFRNHPGKYVDDVQVSDHYAIIPTGQGFEALQDLAAVEKAVFIMIANRFLSIFYPPAVYRTVKVTYTCIGETFVASYKALKSEGWMVVTGHKDDTDVMKQIETVLTLSWKVPATFEIKVGESQPPKRYTTGSMILAMENAGKLIEDPEMREQIKSSGIGTSATRAAVIEKLEKNAYIMVNKKTQVITPGKTGEVIYDVIFYAVPQILKPEYTASWEKGLQGITEGQISKKVYLDKINAYVKAGVGAMFETDHTGEINQAIEQLKPVYKDLGQKVTTVGELNVMCPMCGKPMRLNSKSMFCTGYKEGCKFSLWREAFGKTLADSALFKLAQTAKKMPDGTVTSGTTNLIRGFKAKSGNSFDAKLTLMMGGNGAPRYQLVFETDKKKKSV